MDRKTIDQVAGSFYNGIWKTPMDQSDPFVSALPSMASSPATLNAVTSSDGGMMGQTVPRFNLSMFSSQIRPKFGNHPSLTQFSADPQLELLPKHTPVASKDENLGSEKKRSELWRSDMAEKEELAGWEKESSVTEPTHLPAGNSTEDSNLRKRKSISWRKAKEDPPSPSAGEAKEAGEFDDPRAKRSKQDEVAERRVEANGRDDESQKHRKENLKPIEPPKDYIHVRARRGQATDSHSLAERVRREKIGERMKLLQDLVPGCNKVTGKAVMLDEIINYVQSLQRQVEFLSMKLATVNHGMDFNMDSLLSKDIFQTQGSIPDNSRLLDSLMPMFPFIGNLQQDLSGSTNNAAVQVLMNQANGASNRNPSLHLHPVTDFSNLTSQVPSIWEDDLQSIVQMGFTQNQPESFHTMRSTVAGQLKVEL